jgi:hypothetical protein
MTIEDIKTISIVEYLESQGHRCVKSYRQRYWYKSPLHLEKTPSFKVDMDLNLWYDFGLGIGGNVINLAARLHPELCMHEVLCQLGKSPFSRVPTAPSNDTVKHPERDTASLDETVIRRVAPLGNPLIEDYVQSRRVSLKVARTFCREIYYSNSEGKNFYGLAFPNIGGGWEVRSRYIKRSIGAKQISVVQYEQGVTAARCCLFEGFFDFLAYVTLSQMQDIGLCVPPPADCIILNSVNMLPMAIPLLGNYTAIHCYLDNDEAGRRATDTVLRTFEGKAVDESHRYRGFKDVGDVLSGVQQL